MKALVKWVKSFDVHILLMYFYAMSVMHIKSISFIWVVLIAGAAGYFRNRRLCDIVPKNRVRFPRSTGSACGNSTYKGGRLYYLAPRDRWIIAALLLFIACLLYSQWRQGMSVGGKVFYTFVAYYAFSM